MSTRLSSCPSLSVSNLFRSTKSAHLHLLGRTHCSTFQEPSHCALMGVHTKHKLNTYTWHDLSCLQLLFHFNDFVQRGESESLDLLHQQVHHRAEVATLSQVRPSSQGRPRGVVHYEGAGVHDSNQGV